MITENTKYKIIRSQNFNMFFNKNTGTTITYGETDKDDPDFCPQGPLIADIEVSTICGQGCKFCYKCNTYFGKNMSFELFKDIFHKLPRTLTQIAFGIGDIWANKDLPMILNYCRNNDYQYITPNITINGGDMTPEYYEMLIKTCGAVAVSYYNTDVCFDVVHELTNRGLTQCNIHALLSEESFDECMELIDKVKSDSRLSRLNAVVFLMLKQKGRGRHLHRISDEKYNLFVTKLMASGISFGFDSCGAGRLLNFGIDSDMAKFIEPCESGLFSMYINTEGKFFPCSFTEDTLDWEDGIDLSNITDFVKEVWMGDRVLEWRNILLNNKRRCPQYRI